MNDQLKSVTTAVILGLIPSLELNTCNSVTGGGIISESELVFHEEKINPISKISTQSISILDHILRNPSVQALDLKFFLSIQKFAEEQVELDNDFNKALESLAIKRGSKVFTRNRF